MVTQINVSRTQTGVRIESRMLKVLKGLAEYLDMSMGELLEGMVISSFARKPPFEDKTLAVIEQLKSVYGMDYGIEACHGFFEDEAG